MNNKYKMEKNLIKNKWYSYKVEFDNNIITKSLIKKVLYNYKIDILNLLKNNKVLLMQFKIINKNRKYYKSISYLNNIIKENFNNLFDIYLTL